MAVYSVGKMIKMFRNSLGMTQQHLAEGICDVLTLSRIENGRQKPGKQVYRQLMERMKQDSAQAFAVISGEDAGIFEIRKEVEEAMRSSDYRKAEKLLEDLAAIAHDNPRSRQYILWHRAAILESLKKISPAQARDMLRQALGFTVVNWKVMDMEQVPFLEQELLILNSIALTYWTEGKKEKGIELLESLYQKLKLGYMMGNKRDDLEIMILTNLANFYGETGDHRRAIQTAATGLELCRRNQRSGDLPQLIGEMEWNKEQLLKKGEKVEISLEECKKELRQAYYLAAALGQKHNAEIAKKHYEEYFGENIC